MNKYLGCSYEAFPHATINREGIHVLSAKSDVVSCRTLCSVPYREVDGKTLHLHIILPTQFHDGKKKYPCIVYVQGSAWGIQACGKELAQLSRFATKGYVIAIVQYRHSAWAPFPAQIIDTKYAIQYMIEHKETYFVDEDALFLWGDSSGAHTAMMSSFTKAERGFTADFKEYKILGVVDYYGPTHIAKMNEAPTTQDHQSRNSPEGMLIGGHTVTEENAKATIVMRYIHKQKEIPPLLIVHGSKDRLVPFQQSLLLYDHMIANHKEVECYQLYGGDHGGEPFWSEEVLQIVDIFIKKQISANQRKDE